MPDWFLSRSTAASIPDCFGRSYLRTIFTRCFSGSPSSLCSSCRFRYPCKHLFGILRLFICLHVNFIDCKYKIDFIHVYGLARYIYRCVYVPVRAVTLYFWFLSRFISSPDKVQAYAVRIDFRRNYAINYNVSSMIVRIGWRHALPRVYSLMYHRFTMKPHER